MALFSITALYNYDPTIFEGFRVPETLDRDTVIAELCLQLAELSLVYPSPSTMKTAIKLWTDIHYKEWEDLEETLYYEYNPIWNVDGTEVEERDLNNKHKRTGTDTVNASGKDSIQLSGSDAVANTGDDTVKNSGTDTNTRTGNVTNVREVVGYNESNYAPAEKNTETYNSVADATVHGLQQKTEYGSTATTTYGRKDETTYGRQDQTTYNTTDDIDDTGTITRIRQGNIGVTKTQDLIQSQRDIVQFNVTDFIIRQFKRKFCVMVY